MVRREARRVSTITAETSLRQAQMRNKSGMSEEQAPGQLFITLGQPPVGLVRLHPVEGVQQVSELVGVGGKRVVDAVDVLAEIDPAGPEVRQHLFQGHSLLLGGMPAIVDEDVYRRGLISEPLPEPPVGLVADVN